MNKHAILLSAVLAVSICPTLYAAPVIWTGGAGDGMYTNPANWSTAAIPTGSDIATYQTAGATTVTGLPATNSNTQFGDSAGTSNAGAFTIGATGGTAIAVGNGYFVTVGNTTNPTAVTSSEIFNEAISLGSKTTLGNAISLSNNSTISGVTLTVGGTISNVNTGNSGGSWSVNFRGNGNKIFSGTINETTPSGNATTPGFTQILVGLGGGGTNTGTTTLSNANIYTGGTIMGGGAGGVILGNKGSLGTGTFTLTPNSAGSTISSNTDLSGANAVAVPISYGSTFGKTIFAGANNLEFSGSTNLNATGASGSQTFQVDNSQLTTLSGTLSQTSAASVTKTGLGTLILSGSNNAYTSGTTVSAGTLLVNNAPGTGSGTGSGGVTVNGGTLGGSGTIAGNITVTAGSFNPGGATGNSTAVLTSTASGQSALVLATGDNTTFDVNGTTIGTGYDNFTTAGKVTYAGVFTIDLTSVVANATTIYHLFTSGIAPAGSFASVTLIGGVYSGDLTNSAGVWSRTFGTDTVSFAQGTGDLTVVAVPEPASIGFALGGLTLLARRRRTA